ncbi:hypothetical protein Y032_0009g830 [Ancylostoma ceylanicum]|uniref:SCP domain-containing protein n=1 Tax=Ancylostoma ceylanicum TaxID=53326 RepID=A0A016VKU3_9BILA|nr:hypothetical protein Y032_0009g830 [Ancylostoma ceylanicum]
MQWLLVLLSATALLAETPENPIDCAMAQHYRKKIENFHKELRSGIPEAKYDCELERKARLDKIDGYGTIKIKFVENVSLYYVSFMIYLSSFFICCEKQDP